MGLFLGWRGETRNLEGCERGCSRVGKRGRVPESLGILHGGRRISGEKPPSLAEIGLTNGLLARDDHKLLRRRQFVEGYRVSTKPFAGDVDALVLSTWAMARLSLSGFCTASS